MASSAKFVMNIDANGQPAISELGDVKGAVAGVDDELGNVSDSAGNLDSAFEGVSGKVKGLAGPAGVAAVGTALFAAAEKAAITAENAAFLAEAMNLTLEDSSKLISVFDDVGVETDGVLGILESVTARLEEDEELAEKLGVRFGENVEPIEAMEAAIDNWDLLTPTERVELFGEEGVIAISKIIREGDKLGDLLADVPELEVITPEELERARQYRESVEGLKTAWDSFVIFVGQTVIPILNEAQRQADFFNEKLGSTAALTETIGEAWGLVTNPIDTAKRAIDGFASAVGLADEDVAGLVRSVELIPDRDVKIRVTTEGTPQLPPGFSFPARPTTVNQTINLGRAATAADVAAASATWRHLNGR